MRMRRNSLLGGVFIRQKHPEKAEELFDAEFDDALQIFKAYQS
jgi:hypothetical protein